MDLKSKLGANLDLIYTSICRSAQLESKILKIVVMRNIVPSTDDDRKQTMLSTLSRNIHSNFFVILRN